jgi:putative membrane protein
VVDPTPLALVGLAAALWWRGARRWAVVGRGGRGGRGGPVDRRRRPVARGRAAALLAGLAVVVVALEPPLESRAGVSLTAHMVQHVLLLAVAPPLLVLGGPLPTMLWGLPDRWRRALLPRWRAVHRSQAATAAGWWRWAAATVVAQAVVMCGWHAPVLYQAALHHGAVHQLEHASFLAVATLFWWTMAGGRRSRRGAAVLALFVAAFPGTALGAAMLLAPHPWYAAYPSAADQQLAGVVMWSIAGLVDVVAAATLFFSWLSSSEPVLESRWVVQ